MKKKSKKFLLIAAFAMVGMGTFVSCDDYENDLTASLQGQISDLAPVVQEQIDSLSDLIARFESDSANVWNNIGDVNTAISDMKNAISDAQAKLNDNTTKIADLAQASSQLEASFAELSGKVNEVNSRLGVLSDSLSDLVHDASRALALAEQDSVRIDEVVSQAAANLEAAKEFARQEDAIVLGKLDETNGRLDEIEAAYMKADSILRDSIDALRNDVNDLLAKYERLNQKIANLITGIVVQGAESPVFGYMNLPIMVRFLLMA